MSKQPLSRVSPLVAPGIACVEMVGAGECGRNGGVKMGRRSTCILIITRACCAIGRRNLAAASGFRFSPPGTLPARSDDLQVGIDPHDGVEAGVRPTWW